MISAFFFKQWRGSAGRANEYNLWSTINFFVLFCEIFSPPSPPPRVLTSQKVLQHMFLVDTSVFDWQTKKKALGEAGVFRAYSKNHVRVTRPFLIVGHAAYLSEARRRLTSSSTQTPTRCQGRAHDIPYLFSPHTSNAPSCRTTHDADAAGPALNS